MNHKISLIRYQVGPIPNLFPPFTSKNRNYATSLMASNLVKTNSSLTTLIIEPKENHVAFEKIGTKQVSISAKLVRGCEKLTGYSYPLIFTESKISSWMPKAVHA